MATYSLRHTSEIYGDNITIMLVLRALLSFEARVFSFAARRVIYARREAEGINDTEGCK